MTTRTRPAKQFPEFLFVRRDSNDTGATDFWAFSTEAAAVDDDGPTLVAKYGLLGVEALKKSVQRDIPVKRRRK